MARPKKQRGRPPVVLIPPTTLTPEQLAWGVVNTSPVKSGRIVKVVRDGVTPSPEGGEGRGA